MRPEVLLSAALLALGLASGCATRSGIARARAARPGSSRTSLASGPLRAGAAEADLLEGLKGPWPLATYGPLPPVARGVRAPLAVRALVLGAGRVRIAIASCDLLIIDAALREAVQGELAKRGRELDGLLLAATHTHTGLGGYVANPAFELAMLGAFDPAIRRHIARRIADAIEAAAAHPRPALLGRARLRVAGIAVERRVEHEPLEVPLDVVRLTGPDASPIALLVRCPVHPVLERADRLVAPDYPGRLARELAERHGPCLVFAGALGDVDPIRPPGSARERDPELAARLAHRLAARIEAALPAVSPPEDPVLGFQSREIELPGPNAAVIPDFLWPLDRLVTWLAGWKNRYTFQALRLGDVELLATASELSWRVGAELERRSPAPFPMVVVHANGYAGYTFTPARHALHKLDPSSLFAMHSASAAAVLVESAEALEAGLWPERATGGSRRSPGLEDSAPEDGSPSWFADATHPLVRRPLAAISDSRPDRLRAVPFFRLVEGLRGAPGVSGRAREAGLRFSLERPGTLRWDIRAGYRSSSWRVAGREERIDGPTDPVIGLQHPFRLAERALYGDALRLQPRLSLGLPVGRSDRRAPLRLSPGTGTWRLGLGAGLEWNRGASHTLALDVLHHRSLDRDHGRRPADSWSVALRATERHGIVGFHIGVESRWWGPDRRRGGLAAVDRPAGTLEVGFLPGLSLHPAAGGELTVEGSLPLASAGRGAGHPRQLRVALLLAF